MLHVMMTVDWYGWAATPFVFICIFIYLFIHLFIYCLFIYLFSICVFFDENSLFYEHFSVYIFLSVSNYHV